MKAFVPMVLLALMVIPTAVLPHGGGLDLLGCHHDRKRGGYHCHRGLLAGESFSSKADAEKELKDKEAQPSPKENRREGGKR